jgi:hypothetical protein
MPLDTLDTSTAIAKKRRNKPCVCKGMVELDKKELSNCRECPSSHRFGAQHVGHVMWIRSIPAQPLLKNVATNQVSAKT